jgi:hypothetical protein
MIMPKLESLFNYCPSELQPALEAFQVSSLIRDERGYPIDAAPILPIDYTSVKRKLRKTKHWIMDNNDLCPMMGINFIGMSYGFASYDHLSQGSEELGLIYASLAFYAFVSVAAIGLRKSVHIDL